MTKEFQHDADDDSLEDILEFVGIDFAELLDLDCCLLYSRCVLILTNVHEVLDVLQRVVGESSAARFYDAHQLPEARVVRGLDSQLNEISIWTEVLREGFREKLVNENAVVHLRLQISVSLLTPFSLDAAEQVVEFGITRADDRFLRWSRGRSNSGDTSANKI